MAHQGHMAKEELMVLWVPLENLDHQGKEEGLDYLAFLEQKEMEGLLDLKVVRGFQDQEEKLATLVEPDHLG